MNADGIAGRLALWNRWLHVNAGGIAVLLAFAIMANAARKPLSETLDWYFIWLPVQALATLPGITLLVNRFWPGIDFRQRFRPAFAHLAVAWAGLFAFGLRTGSDEEMWLSAFPATVLVTLVGGSAVLLGLSYALLSRSLAQTEELFP